MAVKKTGISRDLIIHPGETIADVLEERGITQAELAMRTGVTAAYVSNVIAGKKDISAKFAFALEYALGVPKSFWLNLQANYDAELLEYNEANTITEEEREARESLKDIVKYLRSIGKLGVGEKKDESILSLRKVFQISNIANLKDIAPAGAFRMANSAIDPYVLGAWIRMCQISADRRSVETHFDVDKTDLLVSEIKQVMLNNDAHIQRDLRAVMAKYGIDFSVVKNFRGAPVQGYISQKDDGTYQMVLTIRGAYADIFWFSLFHELGHIVNGDIRKSSNYVDMGSDEKKERAADLFASNRLLEPEAYELFIENGELGIDAIKEFAISQDVMPYVVIGRLQKEGLLDYRYYKDYKIRYKWAE